LADSVWRKVFSSRKRLTFKRQLIDERRPEEAKNDDGQKPCASARRGSRIFQIRFQLNDSLRNIRPGRDRNGAAACSQREPSFIQRRLQVGASARRNNLKIET